MRRMARPHESAPGRDGAKEETDYPARVPFKVFLILQILSDQDRMAEVH